MPYKYFTTDELKCKHTGDCDMDDDFMEIRKMVERLADRLGLE